MKYKTLVISPHCDDEILGCGGILNNRIDENVFVYYIGIDVFHVISQEDRLLEVDSVAQFLSFDYVDVKRVKP